MTNLRFVIQIEHYDAIFGDYQYVGLLTWWGPEPDISGFETSGHIDHQMSSPVGRLAMIVRLADSLIICCHFETILTVFL